MSIFGSIRLGIGSFLGHSRKCQKRHGGGAGDDLKFPSHILIFFRVWFFFHEKLSLFHDVYNRPGTWSVLWGVTLPNIYKSGPHERVRGELIIFAWAAVFWLPCRTGESQVTSLDHERISVTVRAFAGHPCYFGWTGWRQDGSRPKSSAQTPAPDYQTLTEACPQPLCLPEVVFGRLVIVSEPTPAVTQCRCS